MVRNSCTESSVVRRHARKSGSKLLIVHIHAVQRDVALIAFAAIDGTAAIVVPLAGIAEKGDSGLDREQADYIARIKREFQNRTRSDRVANGGILRIHLHGFGAHGNALLHCAYLEVNVNRGGSAHQQANIAHHHLGKTGRASGDLVGARLHLRERIAALRIRGRRALLIRFGVFRHHFRPRNNGPRWIGHHSGQR